MSASPTSAALAPEKIEALMEAIGRRRSLGFARLLPDPVDRSILEQAFEAANWAPSNGDTEPWRFTVFTGDARNELGKVFGEAYRIKAEAAGNFKLETFEAQIERATGAPVYISIGMTPALLPDGTQKESTEEEMMAVACAVQNMHLVLAAHGLIGMWHSKGVSVDPHVASHLGLDAPSKLLGFFWCGYPKVEWPQGERGDVSDRVKWAEVRTCRGLDSRYPLARRI